MWSDKKRRPMTAGAEDPLPKIHDLFVYAIIRCSGIPIPTLVKLVEMEVAHSQGSLAGRSSPSSVALPSSQSPRSR
jgi:hypothetical protein